MAPLGMLADTEASVEGSKENPNGNGLETCLYRWPDVVVEVKPIARVVLTLDIGQSPEIRSI